MLTWGTWYTYWQIIFMPKGTFKPYLLCKLFAHEKAGSPQINEESPLFFVYRIKSRFSVKRRNPNPSPTWKIEFKFTSFVILAHFGVRPEAIWGNQTSIKKSRFYRIFLRFPCQSKASPNRPKRRHFRDFFSSRFAGRFKKGISFIYKNDKP